MRAILLAAGLGTRLGALSDELPKPLLPVAGYPLLRYGLALLAAHDLREAAINLHHRGDLIVDELSTNSQGISITWSREEAILGTGGALKKMAAWLTRDGREPFLVMNGKLVIDLDLPALLDRHRTSGALATLVVREVPDPDRWGSIDLDPEGRVLRILGEGAPVHDAPAARRTMFTGVHVVSPALLDRLPDGESCVIRKGYIPALRAGAHLATLLHDRYFQEHSTPERYLAGNFALLADAPLRHPPGPLTGVDPSAQVAANATLLPPYRIAPGATVGHATVGPHAVVGPGARVSDGAWLTHTVVWPGATATGHLDHAIVTPRGVFPVER